MELLNQRTGTQIVHVPYKGSGPLKTDLLGGHLALGVDGLGGLSELIRAGVAKLNAAFAAALQAPDVHDQFNKLSVEAVGGSSDEFRNYLLGERKKWAGVIKTANIKAD